MKAVIQSVPPRICAKIISGECTMLLSKTNPNCGLTFKDYIYETKGLCDTPTFIDEDGHVSYRGRGAVIAEFVCDYIRTFITDLGNISVHIESLKQTTLTLPELITYSGNRNRVYGLHISDLKIYDTPKELGEFFRPCDGCDKLGTSRCTEEISPCRAKTITRPFPSWGYVEELSE